MAGFHIAALFETTAAAHAARESLIKSGVDATHILVLDRGNHESTAPTSRPRRLWATLKHVFVPDEDAHHYAEGIMRGHPLLVADVTEAERPAALEALAAAHPLNVDARAEAWRDEGWDGTYPGQEEWQQALDAEREAAGSQGIEAGGLMLGDYGAVGGGQRSRVDTNILRGKSFTAAPRSAERVDEVNEVRVYEVK